MEVIGGDFADGVVDRDIDQIVQTRFPKIRISSWFDKADANVDNTVQ
jgi:hypothetical protein